MIITDVKNKMTKTVIKDIKYKNTYLLEKGDYFKNDNSKENKNEIIKINNEKEGEFTIKTKFIDNNSDKKLKIKNERLFLS